MKALLKILAVLMPVLIILNAAGGIVGGIWAAINSDWWAVGYVILGMVVSPYVISIALMPGLAIGVAGAAAMERGRVTAGRSFFAVGSFYTNALMLGWAFFVTLAFLGHSRNSSLFPILLLAYGSSTGPWAFLASKDQQGGGNEFSAFGVLLIQVGYVFAAAMLLLDPTNGLFFLGPIGIAMGINWLVQQLVMAEMAKAQFVPPSA